MDSDRERLRDRPDPVAQALLDEATAYVEKTAFTGMPREAADYDLDYARFMQYREKIRHALEKRAD